MLTILYEEGQNTVHSQDASMLPALLSDTTKAFWLDLETPTPEEFAVLEEQFHFHPLAIEDARNPHQRAKVDEYEGYFFLAADEIRVIFDSDDARRDVSSTSAEDSIQTIQVGMFLGANYLVTVHIAPAVIVAGLRERCQRSHRILDKGADYLLYSLLDAIVDDYFPTLDALDDRIEELEDRLIARPTQDILQTILSMKRLLNLLRKRIGSSREVLQTLSSRDFPCVQDSTLPYLRDVADHLFRIYETLDNDRDIMSGMLDVYLSQVSNEMNRVMQKLSAVATVFLPITFITGVFGMNFTKQPWINTNFWFWAFTMLGIAIFTYWWFHRRRWV